jgi:type VI secretion system secreted protein Hcp
MPIYAQFSGIPGNVQHVPGLSGSGWIEISSFQFGVGRGITAPGSGSSDGEGSTPSVSEITVTKPTDVASPNLFKECLGPSGNLAVSVVFTNVGPPFHRHTLKLSRAVIKDIKPQRSGKGGLATYEKLTITFPEHHFNGVRNAPIPHALVRAPF